MQNEIGKQNIRDIADALDIPESAYQKAIDRYNSLAAWFADKKAACNKYDPHIYTQGSFRLGTVIRPLDENGEYDLDMGCRLRQGVTKGNCSQKILKELVGSDVDAYRQANGIKEPKEPKHRCWRLKYADVLKFHLDVVPSIPEDATMRASLNEALGRAGVNPALASKLADHTGAITDDRHPNYERIAPNWHLSNSEGFALWFESRMEEDVALKGRLLMEARAAKIEKVPIYKWKSTLQKAVQVLKAHRDRMFNNDPDGKPASIIITTLAARAYQGQADVAEALAVILERMPALVSRVSPRIPNPVNPQEDFADRWATDTKNNLEAKFWAWHRQAVADLQMLGDERRSEVLIETARSKFGAKLNLHEVSGRLQPSGSSLLRAAAAPAALSFPNKPVVPQKPSGFA